MRVLTQDPPPAELEAVLRHRREIGTDTHDEIWDGVLHMAPAPQRRHAQIQWQLSRILGPLADAAGLWGLGEFNIGQPDDYRVPDAGLVRPGPDSLYLATAALVVEVLSPDDRTWDKLPFYAEHSVDELLIVDPETRKVDWLGLAAGKYEPVDHSGLIDLSPEQLAAQINWPSLTD